jgi:hypothetical protein
MRDTLPVTAMRKALRRACAFGSAAIIISLASFGSASAATFTIAGGTDGTLPTNFDPSNIAAINADGVNVGSPIVMFGSGTTSSQGLFVSPQLVQLTFTFMGKEAGDTDAALLFGGTTLFLNTAATGTSVTQTFNVGANPGLVPIEFVDQSSGGNPTATNGGPISIGTQIAFDIINGGAYVFFDDGGAGPDSDFDDMVVKITATSVSSTPLPAALPLFATGLGALGLFGRRRNRKSTDCIAAASMPRSLIRTALG